MEKNFCIVDVSGILIICDDAAVFQVSHNIIVRGGFSIGNLGPGIPAAPERQ